MGKLKGQASFTQCSNLLELKGSFPQSYVEASELWPELWVPEVGAPHLAWGLE